MFIRELFEDDGDGIDPGALQPKPAGEMLRRLRQAALDVIAPLLGQNVPFVTMKQMIDALSDARSGIVINPALVMQILDPDTVKAVSKIEGDRIYLQAPTGIEHDVDQDQKKRDDEHVSDMAVKQINRDMKTSA